jgi:hypothetical protein
MRLEPTDRPLYVDAENMVSEAVDDIMRRMDDRDGRVNLAIARALNSAAGVALACAINQGEVTEAEKFGHISECHRLFERNALVTLFSWSWRRFLETVSRRARPPTA